MTLCQPLMNPGNESDGFVDQRGRLVKIRLGVAVEVVPFDVLKGGFDFLRSIGEKNASFGQFGLRFRTLPRNLQMTECATETFAEFCEVHCTLRSGFIGVSANGMPPNCG